MKVSAERLQDCQVVLNIEVEPEEMEKSREEAYHRLVRRVNIPGFRRGKAPRPILERYIGEEALQQEALDLLVPQLSRQAIEEQKIEPFSPPQVEIVQNDPVVLKVVVPLHPTVELGDYRNIRISPEKVEITTEQVDKVIEQLRHQRALWEPVERPICFGDLVTIDVEEKIGEGAPTHRSGQQFLVPLDASPPWSDFYNHLLGMTKGEEKEFFLSYPDDYHVKEISGKQYHFKVKVTEIKGERLPELNDEFARGVGEGVDTIDALRERVSANLEKLAEERSKRELEERAAKSIVEMSKVEFPPILIEQEIDRILSEGAIAFGGGQRGKENFLKSIGKTEEKAREDFHPVAKERVARALVMEKIAEEEKIEVEATGVDKEIESMIKNARGNAAELRKVLDTPEGRRWVEQTLRTQKTMQRLVEIVTITEKEEDEA